MNETRRKPTTGRQSPSLCDKWHGIFYMPSCIDEAGHTKAFDYPFSPQSRSTGGKAEMFSSAGGTRTDNTSVRSRTCYQLSHPGSPRGSHNPGSSTGGIVCKEQPHHEKAIPMGPSNRDRLKAIPPEWHIRCS